MRRPILVLTLLAAVLFPLALPNEFFPMGNPFIGIIALSPLYLAYLWAETTRKASLVGALFGAISTFLANYWLMFFGEYSVWTIGGTTLGYTMFNAILGPFLWRALRARRAYRPLLFALIWTGYEFLKSVGFLGYPWGLAAYPYNGVSVLIQIADVTGIWGLTVLAVYLTAVLAEALVDLIQERRISPPTLRNAALWTTLLVIVVAYGAIALRKDVPVRGDLRVLLVQQNADSWNTRDISGPLEAAQQITLDGLESDGGSPDLIVWSETSLRYPYAESRSWYDQHPADQPFAEFLASLPAPLMTGSPHRGTGGEFTIHNAVLLLAQGGEVRQWYGKQQLVPFAEYVPFWESAAVQRFFREAVGIHAIWAPGPTTRLFEIERSGGDPIFVGTPICFEDAFAYVARRFVKAGADVLVNLTNNAWSLTDSAQLQHLVAARFRAVETRRSLVRSTNAGFTGIIDPWGGITSSLPMFEEGFLVADVPVFSPEDMPVAVRWGDYFPISILIGLLVLLVWSAIRPARKSWTGLSD